MKNKQKPLELEVINNGLDAEQLVISNDLQTQYPNIVEAYKKVKHQESLLKGKWLHLCEQLRQPATGKTLSAKEMTILLRGLGENKSRVSEIVRVVSVDDEIWRQYKEKLIGFRAVLQLSREKDNPVPENKDSEESSDSEDKSSESSSLSPVYRTLPDAMRNLLHEAGERFYAQLLPTGKGNYSCASLFQLDEHGRKITFTITVDDVASK